MKHYICRTVTETPAYMQAQINISGDDKIGAGYVFNANKLEDKEGNLAVYELEKISDSEKQIPAILLNNDFETLTDGRRPKGNKDWTTYTFNKGSVVTAIRLLPEIKLEISLDSVILEDAADEIEGYLVPKDNDMQLHYYKNIDESELPRVYLVVEALKDFRLGGNFGGQFAKTFVARVQEKYVASKGGTNFNAQISLDVNSGNLPATMFYDNNTLISIDLDGMDLSNRASMSRMFNGCRQLQEIYNINKLDTSSISDMTDVFQNCQSLTNLDLSNWNVEEVWEFTSMFRSCSNLKDLKLFKSKINDQMFGIEGMFYGCNNLSEDSLNEILGFCSRVTTSNAKKTLQNIGLTKEQTEVCLTLSNWSAAQEAGWTTGY